MKSINGIDQLEDSTATYIAQWKLAMVTDQHHIVQIKTQVREYLRKRKITPYECLEEIRKENACMPGFKHFGL